MIELELKGVAETVGKLLTFPKKQATKAIRKGLRAGAKVMTAAVKAATPVRSGALRRAIKTRAMKRSRNKIGVRTTIGAEGFYKGKTFYGAFVEFGTKKMDARHFMEKAAKRVATSAGQTAINTMQREMEAMANG